MRKEKWKRWRRVKSAEGGDDIGESVHLFYSSASVLCEKTTHITCLFDISAKQRMIVRVYGRY